MKNKSIIFLFLAGFLVIANLAWSVPSREPKCDDQKPKCDKKYGTAIEWTDDLVEASKQALEKEKLLLVLHISGHFNDPDKT